MNSLSEILNELAQRKAEADEIIRQRKMLISEDEIRRISYDGQASENYGLLMQEIPNINPTTIFQNGGYR